MLKTNHGVEFESKMKNRGYGTNLKNKKLRMRWNPSNLNRAPHTPAWKHFDIFRIIISIICFFFLYDHNISIFSFTKKKSRVILFSTFYHKVSLDINEFLCQNDHCKNTLLEKNEAELPSWIQKYIFELRFYKTKNNFYFFWYAVKMIAFRLLYCYASLSEFRIRAYA